MTPLRAVVLAALLSAAVLGGAAGGRAEYLGGTVSQIPAGCAGEVQAIDDTFFVFTSKQASWRVPYDNINLLEYGQKADRRYLSAVLISPLFLLSKARQHFLTIGYRDEKGHQQAMIFRVSKSDIRFILVSLEARTGQKIQFQDDEARKAGKG